MRVTIRQQGVKRVETRFNRMGAAAADARPALSRVADYIFRMEAALFRSQGRRGGGSWRQVTEEWMDRKMKNPQTADARILHGSGLLRRAASVRGAAHQTLEIDRDRLNYGVNLPYARAHLEGRGHMPRRPWIKVTKRDRQAMAKMVQDHLMASWRSRQV